jgi:hypothetical protein
MKGKERKQEINADKEVIRKRAGKPETRELREKKGKEEINRKLSGVVRMKESRKII